MPHFGLMDPKKLGPEEAPLQRARLHIRGGKRRLQQGKVTAGIVTLYDALESAMEWYMAAPERRAPVRLGEGEDMNDSATLFAALSRSDVVNGSFDFASFKELMERSLNEEAGMNTYDWKELVKGVEQVMTDLGVMPFDDAALPPEDPSTY